MSGANSASQVVRAVRPAIRPATPSRDETRADAERPACHRSRTHRRVLRDPQRRLPRHGQGFRRVPHPVARDVRENTPFEVDDGRISAVGDVAMILKAFDFRSGARFLAWRVISAAARNDSEDEEVFQCVCSAANECRNCHRLPQVEDLNKQGMCRGLTCSSEAPAVAGLGVAQ